MTGHDDGGRAAGRHREELGEPPLPGAGEGGRPPALEETTGRRGGNYVYQRNRLVVAVADLDAVRDALDGRDIRYEVRSDEDLVALGYVLFDLGGDAPPVPRLVDDLREGNPDLDVSPNHILARTSHARLVPVSQPRPADPLPDARGSDGRGVWVGVLDTGAVDHDYFRGRCRFRDQPGGDRDVLDHDGDALVDYVAGHGTFCVGVVLQRAPGATVVARRLEPADPPDDGEADQGWTTDLGLATTLRRLLDDPEWRRIAVLNLSVGGYTHDGRGLPLTGAALNMTFDVLPGLVVVAGAGNDGTDEPFHPAADKRVVGVAALDGRGRRACFSNHGAWVDASAPGVDVHSTFPATRGEAKLAPFPHEPPAGCADVLAPPEESAAFDGWARWDGTSFAAPRVVGEIVARMSPGRTAHAALADVLFGRGKRWQPGLGVVVGA